MSARPAREPARGAAGAIRLLGAVLLVVLALALFRQGTWIERVQESWFDALQRLHPRKVGNWPVTVVEIDQKSLAALGQWPWPRTQLARLLRAIGREAPAVIGVNILMPEADALSPGRLLGHALIDDPTVSAALQSLPSNDAVLAQAIEDGGAVLVVAGTPEATGMTLRAAPVTVRASEATPAPTPELARYAGALVSIDELNRRAAGWGLISVDPAGGVVRRIPMVASIDGTMVPTLAVEMLRVAIGAAATRLTTSGRAVTMLSVGDLDVPTESDGHLRVYFSAHAPERFASALDVLEGRVDPALLHRQLVLIGITGIGLHEYLETPLGQRMSGSEIQAQLLENLVDGTWLRRSGGAPLAEAMALLLLGSLLVWITPKGRPLAAAGVLAAAVALLLLGAVLAFRGQRLLFDAASPAFGLVLLFGVLLSLTLAEATRQRRQLERVVQLQREQAARIAGELEAAQRIQQSMLPPPERLATEPRVDLHVLLAPAREVGGDLYDYFMLDDRRLFVLVGDVAGKGLSASIFMAVSKALCKSATLRASKAADRVDPGRIISEANAEVSRDNAQMLFVTAFAGILDLQSGEFDYCNAGHDNPIRLHPAHPAPLRITDGDGPPLCAVPGFPYAGARCRLRPGELLCLMSDGVTEAQSPSGELYGPARVLRLVGALDRRAGARQVVQALRTDVLAFAEGAEPADDVTILALRWLGPEGSRALPTA